MHTYSAYTHGCKWVKPKLIKLLEFKDKLVLEEQSHCIEVCGSTMFKSLLSSVGSDSSKFRSVCCDRLQENA